MLTNGLTQESIGEVGDDINLCSLISKGPVKKMDIVKAMFSVGIVSSRQEVENLVKTIRASSSDAP